jgi:hypothetical protein
MQPVPQIDRPLLEVLKGPKLDAETQLQYRTLMPLLIMMREWPDIAMQLQLGIVEPTHQRTLLRQAHRGAGANVIVASRGTSKSTSLGVQYPVYRLSVFGGVKAVLLSASGFRGGQQIFNDLQRLVNGGWDSQLPNLTFIKEASKNPKVIHRAQNYWGWPLKNHSEYTTLPTNDPDKIRGIRANILMLDECNFMNPEIIEKVAKPFLNVRGDFLHGGAFATQNQLFYTTTVDYAWRPFTKVMAAAREALRADYEAIQTLGHRRHGVTAYNQRALEGFNKYTYCCFDYSDIFIRRDGRTRDSRKYTVKWPNRHIPLTIRPFGIPYTVADHKGHLLLKTGPSKGWSTYPIDFDTVEGGLFDGSVPMSSWASEQRNVIDSAVGNVFRSEVLDVVCQVGDRHIIPYDDCSKEYQDFHKEEPEDYSPSIMWQCTDPCVLGVDYAGGNRDFAAFVVIRVGPLAKQEFDPLTGKGKTRWSNVIWCEQHRLMSHEDAANKIRTLMERYNLVYHYEPGIEDDWRLARAIGLDMRGGGVGVRDQLVYINEPYVPENRFRIYDPLDADPRIQAYANDRNAKPMLDTISPTDTLNDKLVTYLDGQFEAGMLYLPKWIPELRRPERLRPQVAPAYNTVKVLETQLRKVQQEPTKNARRFFMAGDNDQDRNKKDSFSALMYAAKQMRAHVIRQAMVDSSGVATVARRTQINQGRRDRPFGRNVGSKM